MTDELPLIKMTFASNGAPVVIVGSVEVIDPARILPLAPELTKPEWVLTYAALVNHLAQGARFEPIYDPEAFMAAYIARYQGEVPEDEPRPGVTRLHDFGLPDFAAITPPRMEGDTLIFFAENTYMSIPYQVIVTRGKQPEYAPMAMVG